MAAYKSPLDLGRDLQEEDAQQSRVVAPIEYIDPTGKKWTRGDFKDETNLANEYGRTRNTMAYDKGRIYKDNRNPERQAQGKDWITQETQRQLATNPGKQKIAHFIYGNGGVGKSSYIRDQIQGETPSLVMDSDIFTEDYIPESKINREDINANPERHRWTQAVHDESSYLRDQMFDPLFKEGYNVVIPKVHPRASDIQKLKDLGYSVRATYLNAPRDVSRYRGLKRRVEGGRFLPTELYSDPEVLKQEFQALVDSGLLDEYSEYETGDQNDLTKFFRNLIATNKK